MDRNVFLNCCLDLSHSLSKNSIKLACRMDRFACYDCILKNVNYNGVYHCKNCESDHKELLNLSSGALENLKSIFKFYQNIY